MLPLLRIKDLSAEFISDAGVKPALEQIDFSVSRGEIVSLVGESGSGKSETALSVLRLLPTPPARYTSGSILFSPGGADPLDLLTASQLQLEAVRGNQIGMIFQEPMSSLNPVYTCGEQVSETIRRHRDVTRTACRLQTIDWFRRVQLPNPEQLYHRYPHELSGGQKQRVMIAMAMCCEPALLICDEPTTALDVTVQRSILDLIRTLQEQPGMGVLFITHDLGVVAEVSDRVVVMYQGRLVEQGQTARLLADPRQPYTKALLACRPSMYTKGVRLPVVSDFLTTTLKQSGEPATDPAPGAPDINKATLPENAPPLLTVSNLTVSFPGKRNLLGRVVSRITAVNDVSFEVYPNETLGLVGESGCGKSTLGRTLLRLQEHYTGSVRYDGQELRDMSSSQLLSLRRKMQIIFQDPFSSLNPRMTIGEAIAEPIRVHATMTGDLGVQQAIPGKTVPVLPAVRERVFELMTMVGLDPDFYHRYPHEFSGGQRQRIVIARALALRPSFLVCDESVSALDVSVQAQVLNLLNELRRKLGFTIIFISHDLSVVRYISDRILVMHQGRIEETGPAEQVFNNPSSDYTKRLLASIPKLKTTALL